MLTLLLADVPRTIRAGGQLNKVSIETHRESPQSRGSVRRGGVLRTTPFADPNSPEATGGGNIGYNRGLPDGGY
jgi:hypothetical protein